MPVRKLLLVAALLPGSLLADDVVRVAVASNFIQTAAKLTKHFSQTTAVSVRISSGSTGKLYAQIINGAPFDVFLAADTERPRLLEQGGYAVPGTRATYATGSLVLWSRDERLRGRNCREVLQRGDYNRLAIANPETAPYGEAAMQFLVAEGLWQGVSSHVVYGENIVQTLNYAATGNATLAIVAASLMSYPGLPSTVCMWRVPQSSHAALNQQLVLLERAADDEAANSFVEYLRSDRAAAIIERDGYTVVR